MNIVDLPVFIIFYVAIVNSQKTFFTIKCRHVIFLFKFLQPNSNIVEAKGMLAHLVLLLMLL